MEQRTYVAVRSRTKYYLGRRMTGAADVQIIAEFTNPSDLNNITNVLNADLGLRLMASELNREAAGGVK